MSNFYCRLRELGLRQWSAVVELSYLHYYFLDDYVTLGRFLQRDLLFTLFEQNKPV